MDDAGDLEPSRTVGAMLFRALPQIAGVVIGLLLATRGGVVGGLGVAVLVLAVLGVVLAPRMWWEYVRTGHRPRATPDAAYAEPGTARVVLLDVGPRRIEVIKAVREVTGGGLNDAKEVLHDPPSLVVADLSPASAERVRERLERTGATARVD